MIGSQLSSGVDSGGFEVFVRRSKSYARAVIQRFCFIKLVDEAVPERGKIAELIRAELKAACADAVVGLPADESAARWDLSIVFTAATLEAWKAVAALPGVVRALEDVAVRASVVKAWTFEGS